jgi:hypothetical protein
MRHSIDKIAKAVGILFSKIRYLGLGTPENVPYDGKTA